MDILVTGTGTPCQRLGQALPYLASVKKKDLPKEAHSDLALIAQRIPSHAKSFPSQKDIRMLSDEEARLVITHLLDMFDKVTRYQPLMPHTTGEHQAEAARPGAP